MFGGEINIYFGPQFRIWQMYWRTSSDFGVKLVRDLRPPTVSSYIVGGGGEGAGASRIQIQIIYTDIHIQILDPGPGMTRSRSPPKGVEVACALM